MELANDGLQESECAYTPIGDVRILLGLVKRRQPKSFLEIGCNRGHTTKILAERFPGMRIVGVDPGDQIPSEARPAVQRGEFPPQDRIGVLAREMPNVEIIKRPFCEIDWGDCTFDMIFIDGNHFLPHVLDDSLLAMKLLAERGVIVWHDYGHIPDVKTAIDRLPIADRVIAVEGTWIAYYDSGDSWCMRLS